MGLSICPKAFQTLTRHRKLQTDWQRLLHMGHTKTLHVPAGSIEAYKADKSWNNFKKIVEIKKETNVNKYTYPLKKTQTL